MCVAFALFIVVVLVHAVVTAGDRLTIAVVDASARKVQWEDPVIIEIPTPANASTTSQQLHGEPFVTIGVKTNVLQGVAARQAIRATWGQKDVAQALGVEIWFVGCEPDLSSLNEADRIRAVENIELEKATYQDLLTHELRCNDSFVGRVSKTIEFMHFVHVSYLSTASAFVMMADDDVYVRLDSLIDLMQSGSIPHERLYVGNAPTEAQRDPSPPIRDVHSRFSLSMDEYPMSELPPYIASAQYLLSRDIVEFIALNRDDLQGFDGLDDITMAMWMLCLQVHPTFLDSFQLLHHAPCTENLASYANLSPAAMYQIHSNLQHDDLFCANYSYDSWYGIPSDLITTSNAPVIFEWDLQHDPTSMALHIQVGLVIGDVRTTLVYVPSAGPYDQVFCRQLLNTVRTQMARPFEPAFCANHRHLLQEFLHDNIPDALRAKTAIAWHNLARAEADEDSGVTSPIMTVALSPMSVYSRVVLECLLTQVYPDHHIVVFSESDLSPQTPPDIFVFSILDELKREEASESTANDVLGTGATFIYKYGPTSRLIMVSGEAWPTYKLHPHVTLLSTVHTPRHPKHVYLPYSSAVFGEMVHHDPTELLHPIHPTASPSRFCAYLYSNCRVLARQRMFDILNAMEPVDALGRCKGSHLEPDDRYLATRFTELYIDAAVDLYRGYKFVIAFENSPEAPGYMTEKIVTAFLAGAVPIYSGDSAGISHLFNPRAFINCGEFESLEACAKFVRHVHTTPSEYEAMKNEAPIGNKTAFMELFSWHPIVAERIKTSDVHVISLSEQFATLIKK